MQLDGIDVFVEVVEARSFARAADRLRMPPATVSAKIARLEARLGVTLILRTTRRLHVTEMGQTYYRHCARALAEMREGQQQLVARADEPAGLLRISAAADIAQSVLPPIVETFLATYSHARIELVVTNRMVDLVSEGIDMAVRAGALTDSRLVARKLLTGHLALWAAKAYVARHGTPSTPDQLAAHAVVGLSIAGSAGLTLRAGQRTLKMPEAPRLRCDDFSTLRRFVGLGAGIGLLPHHVGVSDHLVPVLPAFKSAAGQLSLVYAAQRFVSPVVKAFIACATKAAR